MTPKPVIDSGISIGTIVLFGSITLLAVGTVYYLTRLNRNRNINQIKKTPIKKILSDENRYKGDTSIIATAIKEKDWETLEDMLNSDTRDFPDLIEIIKEALNNK
jgi:tRNA A37 N6-isopentenylltransferase MiaA